MSFFLFFQHRKLSNPMACSHASACLGRHRGFSLVSSSIGVKPTKNTSHLLALGKLKLKGIGS
ncbi:hypothetical protein MXB_4561 [Myxobolus squamalis]|nr:hypothetical protein MXB_4561 [Myxobolus squamalis]